MCEAVVTATAPPVPECGPLTDEAPAEFAALNPPQQCDEPMPPYKLIKPVYDGHFTERYRQLDAVRLSSLSLCLPLRFT